MAPPPGTGPIVLIGGGASAAFLLHALAEHGNVRRPIVVVEPAEDIGRGVAYGTTDPTHLMNVCRIRLSVDGDGGGDLPGWLAERGRPAGDATYLPRRVYGDYLVDVAGRATARIGIDHRRSRVIGLGRDGGAGGWTVELADGTTVAAGDVVVATGLPARPTAPCRAPDGHPRLVTDPWGLGAFDVPDLRRVAVVGTGLTMVDVALSLVRRHPGVEIVAASRRGLLPRTSRSGLPAPIDPERLPEPAPDGRALVRQVIRLGRAEEDWQAVVDNLRPRANDLWRALPHADQARILHRWFPWWNIHRHRTAPEVGARLARLLADGQLRVVRSRVDAVQGHAADRDRLTVRYAAPVVDDLDVDLVVNAAGPSDDVTACGDPLVGCLLASGAASVGPHRLGLAVDGSGGALGRDGVPTPGLWLLGALRRGTEWETTAVPEIRNQAVIIAERLVDPDRRAAAEPVGAGRC